MEECCQYKTLIVNSITCLQLVITSISVKLNYFIKRREKYFGVT